MGRPDFRRLAAHPAPLVAHALHDDDVNEDVVEAVHDELLAEPAVEPELEPTLLLGCRWRVPLTRVHNPFGVLLLYEIN